MKIIRLPQNKYIISIGIFVLLLALFNFLGYVFDIKYISVFKAVEEVNKYEVKSQLLMQAMDYTGVCNPEDAAKVWSKGLMKRSAAMQYSQMSKSLKDRYASSLEQIFPNWVTGLSSPWISGYEITKSDETDNTFIYHIVFLTQTSTGPAGNYNAYLTIAQEDGFWRIIQIITDKELYPYTGFKLE